MIIIILFTDKYQVFHKYTKKNIYLWISDIKYLLIASFTVPKGEGYNIINILVLGRGFYIIIILII